jgi:hypothetical protein
LLRLPWTSGGTGDVVRRYFPVRLAVVKAVPYPGRVGPTGATGITAALSVLISKALAARALKKYSES